MSASKQWCASRWNSHTPTAVVAMDDDSIVGVRLVAECDTPETARLVAAAPELLDALKEMRDWYQKYIGLPACAANAAIAKATGEQA